MISITKDEWRMKEKVTPSYIGRWEPTPFNLDRVRKGELPAGYIGRRSMLAYEEGHGTCLLTEGVHFIIEGETNLAKDVNEPSLSALLGNELLEVLDKHDMHIICISVDNGQFNADVEFFSPAGEDVIRYICFDGSKEGFVRGFETAADDFDADENAAMWVESRGQNGVPSSIRVLIEDAEAIKKALVEAAAALRAAADCL